MEMKAGVERWNIFYLMVSWIFSLSTHHSLCIYIYMYMKYIQKDGGVKIASVFVTLQSLDNKYRGITTADTLPQVFAHLFMQLHTL